MTEERIVDVSDDGLADEVLDRAYGSADGKICWGSCNYLDRP